MGREWRDLPCAFVVIPKTGLLIGFSRRVNNQGNTPGMPEQVGGPDDYSSIWMVNLSQANNKANILCSERFANPCRVRTFRANLFLIIEYRLLIRQRKDGGFVSDETTVFLVGATGVTIGVASLFEDGT